MLRCLRFPHPALVLSMLLPVLAGAQGGSWHHIPLGENPFFPDSVPRFQRKYVSDTSGNVFAASYSRMLRYAGGVVEDITPDLPPGRVIHGLVADPAGIPWIAVGYKEYWLNAETRAGWSLHRRVGGAWGTVPHATCGAGESLNPLGIDSAGRLILASWKLGGMFPAPSVQALYRAGPAGCEQIPIPQRTDGSLQVEGYTRGPDGAEYLHGFLAQGDIIVDAFLWELRSGVLNVPVDGAHSIRSLVALPGQVLGVANGSLATFHEGRARLIPTLQGKRFQVFSDLFQDSRGAVWAFIHWDSSARILRLHGQDTTLLEIPAGHGGFLSGIVEDADGHIWFHEPDGGLLIHSPAGKPWPLAIRPPRPASRFRPGIGGPAAGSYDALGRAALEQPAFRIFRISR